MSSLSCSAVSAIVILLLGGCSTDLHHSVDYERHLHSQLVQPYDKPGVIYFDVRSSPDYPADDPKGEAVREQWLAGWLKQRGLCPDGHRTGPGRPFGELEDNPARYDRRYEVTCGTTPPG